MSVTPATAAEVDPQFGSFAVYIITNVHRTTLYTGMTNDLVRRVVEHREGKGSAFARRYNLTRLVYWELHPDAWSAIEREKQIKAGSRRKKIDLIDSTNPGWRDLYNDIVPAEE